MQAGSPERGLDGLNEPFGEGHLFARFRTAIIAAS